jgi:EAL and modified HD-GYP domain-containing signal transduction protein
MNTKTLEVIDVINTLHSTTDINVITDKFSLFPELTFNLLRYINSAQFSFRSEITSIRQIINLLGPIRLRSWLGLFVYNDDNTSPDAQAIVQSAKFRANLMRELVIAHKKNELSDEAFLTGSLSLMDVYLELSMEELLEKILLSKSIKDALLNREGYLGKMLIIVEKLEKTEQLDAMINAVAPKLGITSEELLTLYTKSKQF